jgi:hypothetical protein
MLGLKYSHARIARKHRIAGDDRPAQKKRLRNQDAIERISVDLRQLAHVLGLGRLDWNDRYAV